MRCPRYETIQNEPEVIGLYCEANALPLMLCPKPTRGKGEECLARVDSSQSRFFLDLTYTRYIECEMIRILLSARAAS